MSSIHRCKWIYERLTERTSAGYVEQVGANVIEFRKGDRVAAFHIVRVQSSSPKQRTGIDKHADAKRARLLR